MASPASRVRDEVGAGADELQLEPSEGAPPVASFVAEASHALGPACSTDPRPPGPAEQILLNLGVTSRSDLELGLLLRQHTERDGRNSIICEISDPLRLSA